MGLREELAETVPVLTRGGDCKVCTFIGTFPTDEQAEWHDLLAPNSGELSQRLFLFAKHKGFVGTESTWRRHRRDHERGTRVAA